MPSETNKAQASKQYFELGNELNQANKSKNLKTKLQFEIRENKSEYFIIIKSTGATNGLRIAYKYKIAMNRWIIFENEIYADFHKYMFIKIRQLTPADEVDINIILTNWLLGLWVR